jgi:phytoene dehydrogenase-like protein
VTEKHYDVVVLGRSLGALVTAALLARRDFRVLLLGQGARPASYRWRRHVLKRRAFTMLFASSPVWRRVLVELAQTQTFRRRALPIDPMVQVLLDGHRVELPPDAKLFEREIEREFPEVRRVIDELYGRLSSINTAIDAVFEREAIWPPGTFWERRRAARLVSALPLAHPEPGADLFADFSPGHAYRTLASALVGFASHAAVESVPPLASARLQGAWSRGVFAMTRAEDELCEFLLERIEAHGGGCRLAERVSSLRIEGGAAAGVLIDGDAAPIGASFVVSDGGGEQLAELSAGQGVYKRAEREWPEVAPSHGRFVVSIVVRTAGLPEPLGREIVIAPTSGPETFGAPMERGLSLHVVRGDPAAEPEAPLESRGESLLVVEALVPWSPGAEPLDGIGRERVIETLRRCLPFIDRHLVVVDSPHDGRPLWAFDPDSPGGPRREIERIHLQGSSVSREPMQPVWRLDHPGFLSLAGEPVRGPIPRTLLVGSTVLPALGQEGELLAAWSAANLVTRADGQKERIRRVMWNKVELG